MDVWTLQHGDVTKSLADWGIVHASIAEPAFNAGIFTAQIAGDMGADLPWAFKDAVVLKLGETVKFRGTALPFTRQGEDVHETIACRFADPWWWFGQAAYSQAWWDANSSSANLAASVALFAAVTPGSGWTTSSIGAQIEAIVAHCNTLHGGGKMQIGTLSGDGFAISPVPQRLENVTHEAALRRCLQWVPDAIPSWDHSFDPPKLNITQRASATARTYSLGDGTGVISQEIAKREDMKVTGVRIAYLGVDSFGNPTGAVDAAGATSGSGVVEAVINVMGSAGGGGTSSAPSVQPAVEQSYDLVSEEIDVTGSAAKTWIFKYGDTGAATEDDIVVKSASIAFAPNAPENAGKSGLGGCTRQWLSGGIPESLADTHTRIALVIFKVIVHTVESKPGDDDLTIDASCWRTIRMLVPTTNLSEGSTYLVKELSVIMGGGVGGALGFFAPGGLAAQLLAAWSQTQYDGGLRITKEECDEAIVLGDVINVTGSRTEWATMNAQVQGITRDLTTGTTTITLGVAAHMALDEFMSLIKIGSIAPALNLNQQAAGETPTADPDPTIIPQLVTPGSIKISVLEGQTNLRVTRGQQEFGFTTDDS